MNACEAIEDLPSLELDLFMFFLRYCCVLLDLGEIYSISLQAKLYWALLFVFPALYCSVILSLKALTAVELTFLLIMNAYGRNQRRKQLQSHQERLIGVNCRFSSSFAMYHPFSFSIIYRAWVTVTTVYVELWPWKYVLISGLPYFGFYGLRISVQS